LLTQFVFDVPETILWLHVAEIRRVVLVKGVALKVLLFIVCCDLELNLRFLCIRVRHLSVVD
jgi:hypothetical protein